jgi:2-oxoglutarate ferredoxin oxidoreductase subunit alpha
LAAAHLSGKDLVYSSYPITPASDILHELSKFKSFGVRTLQMEDEIAAIGAAIGASFGGAMGVTASSGPGIALKSEALGLAIMLELPLVVINVQRGGPSTGLPTKTEQSDLFQALFGRHGEAPLPVLAARSPADCFDAAVEAWRIATRYMVPVLLLSDGYIANGAEPWRIPNVGQMRRIPVEHPGPRSDGGVFHPYERNERLGRPWALPGTEGLMHRIGGLEKEDVTGNVCYDPANHQHMTDVRARKVENVAADIPLQETIGPDSGKLLVLSWGGAFGACVTAVQRCLSQGCCVAHAHLRYLNPFPANLGDLLDRFERILIPELNMGQLQFVVRARFLRPVIGLNKVTGKPFAVGEIADKIRDLLE